ncbi:MAG: glycosyltransferase family 4 protein [Streptosporangiaceae bacterium]
MATTSNRERPGQRLRSANLDSCRLGIDVRYLRRRGVGISGYVHQAVLELLEAGAELTLLTDSEEHRGALRSAYPAAAAVALPTRSGFRWEQQKLPRHLETARYDAYIAPANYGLPLTYRGPTVLILVVHDLIPLRLGHIYLLPRPLWATKYLLSVGIAAARADRVAAASHATARDVARLLRHRDVSVAYPPIPVPHAAAGGPEPAGSAIPLPDGLDHGAKSYFLYNGGADIRKNVPTLLRAFARIRHALPATDLIMIGPGQEHFHKLIHRLRLEDRVHTLGYVDEPAKESLIKHAVALLYPSRIEGFGLPVLEAMAAGIPVVSGTGGSLAEIGGDAVVYVRPINDQSLATAMLAVSQDTVRDTARLAGISQLKLLMNRRQEGTLANIVADGIRKAPLIQYSVPREKQKDRRGDDKCV